MTVNRFTHNVQGGCIQTARSFSIPQPISLYYVKQLTVEFQPVAIFSPLAADYRESLRLILLAVGTIPYLLNNLLLRWLQKFNCMLVVGSNHQNHAPTSRSRTRGQTTVRPTDKTQTI
jgi:hypothetical protein